MAQEGEPVGPGPGNAGGLRDAVVVDTEKVRGHLDEMVRSTVERTLNQLLDEEADRVAGAGKYERSADRQDARAGNYRRKPQTKAGEVELKVPLKVAIMGFLWCAERATARALLQMLPALSR